MTALTVREIAASYAHVVSEETVHHVSELLAMVPRPEGSTSVVLRESETGRHRSILELEGLGADIWEGVDPKQYVKELRDEWVSR